MDNKLVILVGHSASGKSTIADMAVEWGFAKKVPTYTTRKRRQGEPEGAYFFVSRNEFDTLNEKGFFFETTQYAGNQYGSSVYPIRVALAENNVIVILDRDGAAALKKEYPDAVIVYIHRGKRELVNAVIERVAERSISSEDATNRILRMMDEEPLFMSFCHRYGAKVLENTGKISDATEKLREIII